MGADRDRASVVGGAPFAQLIARAEAQEALIESVRMKAVKAVIE